MKYKLILTEVMSREYIVDVESELDKEMLEDIVDEATADSKEWNLGDFTQEINGALGTGVINIGVGPIKTDDFDVSNIVEVK